MRRSSKTLKECASTSQGILLFAYCFVELIIWYSRGGDYIPLSFILGFYVTQVSKVNPLRTGPTFDDQVVNRWWLQFGTIPWSDRLALALTTYLPGRARYLVKTRMWLMCDIRGARLRGKVIRLATVSNILALRRYLNIPAPVLAWHIYLRLLYIFAWHTSTCLGLAYLYLLYIWTCTCDSHYPDIPASVAEFLKVAIMQSHYCVKYLRIGAMFGLMDAKQEKLALLEILLFSTYLQNVQFSVAHLGLM